MKRILAAACALVVWLGSEALNQDAVMPPQLAGFLASIVGMFVGSLMPRMIAKA